MQQAPVVYGTPNESVYRSVGVAIGAGRSKGNRVRIQRGWGWDEESAHVVPLQRRSSRRRRRRRRQRQRPAQRERRARAYPCACAGGDGVRPRGGGTCELRRRGGRGRGRRGGAARGDEGKVLVEEDARVVYFLLFLLVLSTELRRHELDLVDLGLPAQLSQLDVQLPRARAYERRDGDAPASPRAAYPGASGVAGVVVGGVVRIRARQRLAAPMHHPHRALRKRVRVLVYALPIERGVRHGGGRDERVRAVGAGVAGGLREGAGRREGGGGGRGRGVRGVGDSDEQGHSDESGSESGEGSGEPGAQVNASGAEVETRSYCAARGSLGRSGSGTWEGEPPPPHDERRCALLELVEHQAHAGGAGGGVQVLHGFFALQGRVARRCAEGEREGRGGGVGVEGGGDEGAELGEEGECMLKEKTKKGIARSSTQALGDLLSIASGEYLLYNSISVKMLNGESNGRLGTCLKFRSESAESVQNALVQKSYFEHHFPAHPHYNIFSLQLNSCVTSICFNLISLLIGPVRLPDHSPESKRLSSCYHAIHQWAAFRRSPNPALKSFYVIPCLFCSSLSIYTTTSTKTQWGPGALTGKALLALGKAVIRARYNSQKDSHHTGPCPLLAGTGRP
ncbi:hypothetical protein B0H14DRAFT_3579016 [Mycena olivaceomarginata]|nr:hypothetical protein B0H14DRAFT_3579016 [Mycena olivaceomarginata]